MDLFNCFELDLQKLRHQPAQNVQRDTNTKSIIMKGGLWFAATASRLQLAYACLVEGANADFNYLQLTLPVSSYRHPSPPSREMQVYPQLPQWTGNAVSIL